MNKINAPILIMGTQRSGTTLLTRILSAHPDIFIQNELELPKVFLECNSADSIINSIKKQLFIEDNISIDEMLKKNANAVWGLKDPQLTEYIDQLKHLLPHTKFIIIIRDGRGVVNSYINNKWGLGTNAFTGAQRWKAEVQLQMQFMQSAPDKFLLIRYEDLITDTEKQIKSVCEHLNVPFSQDMLMYYKKAPQFEEKTTNINTNKKPDISISNSWKKNLSNKQINTIEYIAGTELIANGYELIGEKIFIPKWQEMIYKIHQAILGEIQIQYQLKRMWLKTLIKRRETK